MHSLEQLIPPLWARGGHLQTLLGHLAPSEHVGDLEQIIFPLADGDELVGRWRQGKTNSLYVFFHGLGGDIDSGYMHRSAKVALDLGHSALLVNLRGAGEGLLRAKKTYHSGAAEDISTVIRQLRKSYPKSKIITVGFSLSANLLLNLLGGQAGSDLPDASISVNPPIDLAATSIELERGFNTIYDARFVYDLKKHLREKHRANLIPNFPAFPRFTRMKDIDAIYTVPMAGFSSREAYYQQCSSRHYAHKIQTPTIILHAEDDPFIPIEPFLSTKFSSSVKLHIERTGGHLGYLAKQNTPLGTKRWLDYFLREAFLELEKI